MNKIIYGMMLTFVCLFAIVPVYAASSAAGFAGGDVIPSVDAAGMERTEALEETYDTAASRKDEALKERWNILQSRSKLQKNLYWYDSFQQGFSYCLDRIGGSLVRLHDTLFGMSGGKASPSLSERVSGLVSGSVFSWFLTLFIIFQCLAYAVRTVTRGDFQYSEIPLFLARIGLVLIAFYFMPFLPRVLVNTAFIAAEKITGAEVGSLGFSTAMESLSSFGTAAGSAGILAFLSSFAEASFGFEMGTTAELTLSGHALYIVALVLVALTLLGLALSFWNCARLFVKTFSFFVGNIALVVVLPSLVLSNRAEAGRKMEGILKYYFFGMVELFSCAVIILVGSSAIENFLSDCVPLKLSLLLSVPAAEAVLMREAGRIVSSCRGGKGYETRTFG